MEKPGAFSIGFDAQDAKRLLFVLLGVEALLAFLYVMLHILLSHWRWGPLSLLFDFDLDLAVPAWFSSVQLYTAAILAVAVAFSTKHYRWFLLLVGLGLLFLSVDEGASIHERITEFAIGHDIAFLQALMIRNHGAWIIPYLFVGLLLLVLCFRPIIYMIRTHRVPSLLVATGCLIMVVGAVGLEILSYLFLRGESSAGYNIEVAAEEFLEMAGASVVLYGLMRLGLSMRAEQQGGAARSQESMRGYASPVNSVA